MIKLKSLLLEVVNKPKVLFVGDSQTKFSNSYANQLKSSNLIDNSSKVVAQNGASTDIIKTFLNNALSSGKYDIVSIMGGGNDGWRTSASKPISNLQSMYNLAKKSGALVIGISNPTKKHLVPGDKYYKDHKSKNMIYLVHKKYKYNDY